MRYVYIFLLCFSLWSVSASRSRAIGLEGSWAEMESAATNMHVVASPGASGGKALLGFQSSGQVAAVVIAATKPMANAVLFIRYLAPVDFGTDIYYGPSDAATWTANGVVSLGTVPLSANPGGSYSWQRIKIGPLPVGVYRFFFLPSSKIARNTLNDHKGFLDVVDLVDDASDGLYVPTNSLVDGVLTGDPVLLPSAGLTITPLLGPDAIVYDRDVLKLTSSPLSFPFTVKDNLLSAPVAWTISITLRSDLKTIALTTLTGTSSPGAPLSGTIPVRPPGYGWYELSATIATAASPMPGSPQKASFIVIRPPVSGLRPASMFGMDFDQTSLVAEDQIIAEKTGVKWTRGFAHASSTNVAPSPGTWWDQSAVDSARQAVKDWNSHGVECLGFINYNIPWNVTPDPLGRPIALHQNRPKDLALQAEFAYQLIKPLHDLVPVWEVWNEPWVHGWTWRTGEAQDFRDMTKLVWDRVKPEMPDVELIGGGSTAFQRDVVYAKNSTNDGYVDGSTNHAYGPPELNTPAVFALDAKMNQLWSRGGGKAGIWATEMGTSGPLFFPYLDAADQQFAVAKTVATNYLLEKLGAGDTPLHTFWFNSNSNPNNSGVHSFNIWRSGQPGPAVAAYATMTHFIEDSRLSGDIYSKIRSRWALLFTKSDGSSVIAFWNQPGFGGNVRLPATSAGDFTAVDYLGRPCGSWSSGGFTFPAPDQQVVFISTTIPAARTKAAFLRGAFHGVSPLLVTPLSFNAPLSSLPDLKVKLENITPVVLSASVKIAPIPGIKLKSASLSALNLQPGEQRIVTFPLASATANAENSYTVNYSVICNGVAQHGSHPIQVACAMYGTPVIGSKPESWRTISVSISATKEVSAVQAALSNGAKATDLTVTASTTYKVWTMWDSRFLYLAASVPDKTIDFNQPFSQDPYSFPFATDSFQFGFNFLHSNPDDLLRGNPLYFKCMRNGIDYEFIATPARVDGAGPSFSSKPGWKGDPLTLPIVPELQRLTAPGTNHQTYYPTNAITTPAIGALDATPSGGTDGTVVISYDQVAQCYDYEVALPWKLVPEIGSELAKLKPGERLDTGFSFSIHDAGGGVLANWQMECGDIEPGAYGFCPHWTSGTVEQGGILDTQWGFIR